MSLLDRKLVRDLTAMRGQVITIALVVAAGVSVLVASISTYSSLLAGRDRFYSAARFPDVFVTVKRAPLAIVPRLRDVAGVSGVEARIVRDVIVDLPRAALPVSARIVSLSHGGDEPLARLHLRRGAGPAPGDSRRAVVNEAFAEANGIALGTELRVLLNGRLQSFRVSGVALSPEYVHAVKPGVPIPDDRFYAILWIDRSAAEAAFDMKGAFNDAILSLAPDANVAAVIEEVDRILDPYGSVGALARRDQSSNRFLEDELNQQRIMSITIPIIFFGIATFLLNVAIGRVIAAQREQIAALKALGFPNAPLVLHYLKLVAVIVAGGALFGIVGGYAFGHAMILSYHGFFRLPALDFELVPWSVAAATAVSFAAAILGVTTSLRRVVALAPAVAMRPLAPKRFRNLWIERLLPRRLRTPRWAMALRNIAGRPIRTATTIVGVAFAVPMVVLGLFWRDAIDHMMDVQFSRVERGNVAVTFSHPLDRAIVRDLAREPGVLVAEGQRIVPVRLHAGHRTYRTAVIGLPPNSTLRRPHGVDLEPIDIAPDGLTLTRRLAERLGVQAGDTIRLKVMEGRRLTRDLPVSATVDEVIGMASYMPLDALNRLTDEGAVVSAAALYADPSALTRLGERLKQLPVVEATAMKTYTINSFLEKIAGLVLVSAGILTTFAVIIAVGVVYNGARIGLQERAWELASLRVLGFTRGEVTLVLLGQFIVEIAVAIPIGALLSKSIIELIAHFNSNESFQIPPVIQARTYIAAVAVVLAAAAASAYVVRRQIDRLDLVAVLKTRD